MNRKNRKNPTTETYAGLNKAYQFFNDRLFNGVLPPCLLTMQRHRSFYGYFAAERFGSRDGEDITDEIALNPATFAKQSVEEIFSVLVHEMVHLQQHHFGKPSKGNYHNKEWAGLMLAVGLIPSKTGKPGGAQTGQPMAHYIAEGGRYQAAFKELEKLGLDDLYIDLWASGRSRDEGDEDTAEKKRRSKTKYTCPACEANAWAKPETRLICGDCEEQMEPEDGGELDSEDEEE